MSWEPGGWDLAAGIAYASGRALATPLGSMSGLDISAPWGVQRGELHTVFSETPRRLPAYLRVDLGFARDFRVLASEWQVSLKVLNATQRKNPLFYRLANNAWDEGLGWEDPEAYGQRLYSEGQLPRMVSLGLSVHAF